MRCTRKRWLLAATATLGVAEAGKIKSLIDLGSASMVLPPAASVVPFGTLLRVEHERLVASGAAAQRTRVVYRQRFSVGRYDTMDVANDLAILLEIKVPSVCIDLLPERRIRGPARGLLFLLAVAVMHPVRHLLAICACQLLVERVQPVGFGIDTGPGREHCARAELRFRDVKLPGA